jgi:hypothetical protein
MRGQFTKVKVKFYAGHKGEETPRSVLLDDKEFPIDRILERKKILDQKTGEVRDDYTIKLEGRIVVLMIFASGECELVDLS